MSLSATWLVVKRASTSAAYASARFSMACTLLARLAVRRLWMRLMPEKMSATTDIQIVIAMAPDA
jgi:hypothetical protein